SGRRGGCRRSFWGTAENLARDLRQSAHEGLCGGLTRLIEEQNVLSRRVGLDAPDATDLAKPRGKSCSRLSWPLRQVDPKTAETGMQNLAGHGDSRPLRPGTTRGLGSRA